MSSEASPRLLIEPNLTRSRLSSFRIKWSTKKSCGKVDELEGLRENRVTSDATRQALGSQALGSDRVSS